MKYFKEINGRSTIQTFDGNDSIDLTKYKEITAEEYETALHTIYEDNITPKVSEEEIELAQLRKQRKTECFSVINRGQLWYDALTDKQLKELKTWYQAWLDVTKTRKAPSMPSFLQ